MISVLLYVELNLLCAVVLALLLHNLKKSGTMLPDQRLFRYLLIGGIWGLVSDTCSWFAMGQHFFLARPLNIVSSAAYFTATSVMCYLYALYADYKINEDEVGLRRRKPLYSIPCVISVAGALLTPWTGWFFTIDANSNYTRGSIFWLQAVLGWFYLFFPTFYALRKLRSETGRVKVMECRSILLFMLFPLISSLLQTRFYGLALVFPCTTVALLMVFINLQNQQISLDALTNINNRGQLNKYLDIRIHASPARRNLYFILMDVDDFKYINDTYGHAVGDSALIQIAEVLKKVCGQTHQSDFLARYGGDEFAIVCQRKSAQEIEQIIELIHIELKHLSQSKVLPCRLSLSVGYTRFDPASMRNLDQLIAAADAQMYRNKKAGLRLQPEVQIGG